MAETTSSSQHENVRVGNPARFEGIRHRESVLALARAALDQSERDKKDFIDPRTGFGNLKALERDLEAVFGTAKPGDISILFCDLNKLKKVNDTVGWHAGTEYLQTTTTAISDMVQTDITQQRAIGIRPYDGLYSIAGDEIVMLLRHDLDEGGGSENLPVIAARVQSTTRSSVYAIPELATTTGLGLSAGWATMQAGDTPESLVERAHDMMLIQKANLYSTAAEIEQRLADPRLQ